MSEVLKSFKGSRTPGVKGSRDPGLITTFKVLEGHSKSMASKFSSPGLQGSKGQRGSRHVGTYL